MEHDNGIQLTSMAHPIRPAPLKLSALIAQLGQLYLTAGDVPVYAQHVGQNIFGVTKATTLELGVVLLE